MDVQERGKKLTSPEFKKNIGLLLAYLAKRLPLKTFPSSLKLIHSKENADKKLFGLTGHYDHTTRKITLYITDRNETDILRSFAHEVIHHWQNERGTLHPEDNGVKMPTDNETKPHYAQENDWLRKREMEAYLFGCMLYRDFQDEQRMGPPTKEPFLPLPYD
jgi:hypothetical protein